MPGTTRYSATFDRPYEEDEDELPAVPPLTRRSRSQSWQAPSSNSRPYTPLGGNRLGSHARSSSTDNGPQAKAADGSEKTPTRTAGKVSVKVAHNPFQFVKIGSCPLSRKAEEQLKKTQEKKKPEVLKEEEEWQTNLDSWKNRRRKMSEHTIRRQEELKQLEIEEQSLVQQKKIKTFSEMLEERAHQGRSLSLSFFSNPLEVDDWNIDNVVNKDLSETELNDRQDLFGGSEESSNINSEDESDVFQKNDEKIPDVKNLREKNTEKKFRRTGNLQFIGNKYGMNNGIFSCEKNNSNCGSNFQVAELNLDSETLPHKDESSLNGVFIDSGLDSLSSSHRAGDIPDSGSDFSQDSGSSMDCESPNVTGLLTTGMELLEEFSSKETTPYNGITFAKEKLEEMELCLKLNLTDNKSQFGFTVSGGKDKDIPVTVVSVLRGSVCDAAGLKVNDQILAINKEGISCLNHSAVLSALKQATDNKCLELLLWRPNNNSAVDKAKKEIIDKLNNDAVVKKPNEDTVVDKLNKNTLVDKVNKDAVVDKPNRDAVVDKPNRDVVVDKPNRDAVVDKPNRDVVIHKMNKDASIDKTNKDDVVHKTNKDVVDKQNKGETSLESVSAENTSKQFTVDEVVKSSFSSTVNQNVCNKESVVKRSPVCMSEKAAEKGTANKIKKAAPTKQKEATRKKTAPVKPLAQELTDIVMNKDATDNLVPLASTNSEKAIELESTENEEVDNLSAISNSKIPVAEKSTKYLKKEISRATQESKKSKYNMNDKSPENLNNGAKSSGPFKDNSLNIIYESHPILCNKDQQQPMEKETKNKTSSHAVIKNASENKSTVKPKNDPRMFPKNVDPKVNENTFFGESNITSVEKVAEEMERLILEQLEQEEQMKERNTKETVLESSTYANSDISEADNTLHDVDTPLRQLEPPKEKPPPPPLSLSMNNSEMDSSLTRVNSTKRIKKEIQKRRSDFLGIDSSEEGAKYEPSLPLPPGLEHILKTEFDQEKKVRQMYSKQSVTPTKPLINEDEIAQKEREIIENLETEERMRMETQICTEKNNTHHENCDIEEERIRKLKEERQRMEEERFLKEEQRIRFEEERQLRDREQQIKKQEDQGLFSVPLILNSVPQTVVDVTSDAAENKNFPINDQSLDQKSNSFNFPAFTNSAVLHKSDNTIGTSTLHSNCLSRQAVISSCFELKADNEIPKPDNSQMSEKICSSLQRSSKQIVSTKNKIMKKKSKNVGTSESLNGHSNTSVANEKSENVLKEETGFFHETHALYDNTREVNGNSSSALNEGKITTLEGSLNKASPSISEQCVPEIITSKTADNNSNHKGKTNLVKIRKKKNAAARLTGNCAEQDDQKSIAINCNFSKESSQSAESGNDISEKANIISSTCSGALVSSRYELNSRLHETTLGKEKKFQNNSKTPGKHSETNQPNFCMIRAHETVTEDDALDATTSPSSVAESSTNPECITPVSILSSTSLGISYSHHGDGKILNSSSVFPATIDVSNAQGENVNATPPKPLKKKEAIRRERERLRQEQEALQREREDHRRQLILEQERLKKDLPKPHAREDYTYVGPPPPVKPALPFPLTPLLHPSQTLREDVIYSSRSFPSNLVAVPKGNIVALPSDNLVKIPLINTTVSQSRVGQNDEWCQHKVSGVRKQVDSPSESRYNQNHWLIQEAEMRRISEQNERQRLYTPSDTHHAPQKQMQYHPVELGDKGHGGSHIAVQRQIVPPISCPSLNQSSYPVSTQVHSTEQLWNYGQPVHSNSQSRKCCAPNPANIIIEKNQSSVPYSHKARVESGVQPPTKPSRVLPVDRQDQMLSVSGRKRCSHCGEELGRGAAMIIESLQLYYHIHCFRCCVCQAQLGNGSCGTDVRVRNNKLHCHNCYSNDEAGLKFSQV